MVTALAYAMAATADDYMPVTNAVAMAVAAGCMA